MLLDPLTLLDLARDVASEAGALVLEGREGGLETTTKSSPTDVVTQMDRASEELLVARILAARPEDGILGEEGGERAGTSGVRWVLDPIDGTTNYLYGLPIWAVSVGVEVDGVAVAGAIDAPALGRCYWASVGGGAWGEHAGSVRRLQAASTTSLGQALVSTGFGYAADQRARQAEGLRHLAPRVRDMRRLGAASLDLAWVAAGYVDGYFESGLHEWDVSAGALLAREAGAVVESVRGVRAGEDVTIAAAPGIHAALRAALADAGALGSSVEQS